MRRHGEEQPSLSDADFNDVVGRFLDHAVRVLSEDPREDYFEMVVEIRDEVEHIVSFTSEDDDADADWEAMCREYGRAALKKRKTVPQAVLFLFLSKRADGGEVIVLHGAAPDGRQNAAGLEVGRNREGHLIPGDSEVYAHPCDPEELPIENYAKLILEGYTR